MHVEFFCLVLGLACANVGFHLALLQLVELEDLQQKILQSPFRFPEAERLEELVRMTQVCIDIYKYMNTNLCV